MKFLCIVDILIVEDQWTVETNVDLSIKVFLKWKRYTNQVAFIKPSDRDKWTNHG